MVPTLSSTRPPLPDRSRLRRTVSPVVLSVLLLAGCSAPPSTSAEGTGERPLLVFAAASLADALGAAVEAFETGRGDAVECHFAGSNVLAQQIRAGAPADLFLSAGPGPVELLVEAGRVEAAERIELLSNRLVVVVPAGAGVAVTGVADLLGFDRLAMADPAAVPAGVYARRWLSREGYWERLRGRIVPTLDVRSALAAVASGNLPAGVVYATDAATSDRVRVAYRVPRGRAPAIRYELVPVAAGGRAGHAALVEFLTGPDAAAIFERHGFEVLTGLG